MGISSRLAFGFLCANSLQRLATRATAAADFATSGDGSAQPEKSGQAPTTLRQRLDYKPKLSVLDVRQRSSSKTLNLENLPKMLAALVRKVTYKARARGAES